MGAMKCYFEEQIYKLSELTGYSVDFLWEIWNECIDDGASWEFFKGVTLELDW